MSGREAFGKICERVCDEEGWERLPTGVHVRWSDGRHQIVHLRFFESRGEELVRLYSVIGPVARLSPERLGLALEINARLAHGALAVYDAQLVMTDTQSLHEADPGEIRGSLRYLAETADHYEKTFFGTDEH